MLVEPSHIYFNGQVSLLEMSSCMFILYSFHSSFIEEG
uniref:Uncharacterized protein n=1 Tax=Rhizophora mucronata TaxID=61149 RepID=A0A2P2QLD3_RHIMU